jgi:hypothetical protein
LRFRKFIREKVVISGVFVIWNIIAVTNIIRGVIVRVGRWVGGL